MQDLRHFHVGVGVVCDVGFDLGQPLEGRAEADVERRLALAGGEFGDERAADRVRAVVGADAGELLENVFRVASARRRRSMAMRQDDCICVRERQRAQCGANRRQPDQPIDDASAGVRAGERDSSSTSTATASIDAALLAVSSRTHDCPRSDMTAAVATSCGDGQRRSERARRAAHEQEHATQRATNTIEADDDRRHGPAAASAPQRSRIAMCRPWHALSSIDYV